MRIVSLLPSATEILHFIGAFDEVVAVSEDCDFPPAALKKPKAMVRTLNTDKMTSAQIDRAVSQALKDTGTLYKIDEALLDAVKPDIIFSQELCDVCSVTPNHFQKTAIDLQKKFGTRVVSLNPRRLDDIFQDIIRVGKETDHEMGAMKFLADNAVDLAVIESCARKLTDRPRLLFLEWLDPPYNGGHWIADMVEKAGGNPVLADRGGHSRRLNFSEIRRANPDIIVVAPCSFKPERTMLEIGCLMEKLREFKAAKTGNIFISDECFFARPGPRVIDGIMILHSLICKKHTYKKSKKVLWRVKSNGYELVH